MNNEVDIDNLQLSDSRSRIKAFVIDDLLITFVVLILLWDQVAQSAGDFVSVMSIMNAAFLQIIFLKFLYQTFFIWYYGATIGKIIAKIRVIDYDNFSKVSFIGSMARAAVRIVSESIFYLGFALFFYTESKQTLHDKLAKTLVVDAK